ncbi:sigma 54-interacting transcriptional regulator [Candidatus Aminicenantes bacterium AC-708-M15]|jgi:DNA-binding NtrC family response regulator|nr:sigma 54-interacting transcriptional regulator [SCandidatus Aminicenantes bacterium Aminicenantia_JdfR_composite]MCP2596815.1 sigma 54-interacting transcriptional regulator [Candidatus Aminicenantes bacterium AC-335-G13]MCP2598276.1 sigma 54-interacting transcriptional regulator [Candidatus Aminicenantes bacterium AC-335-L06]MCP2604015.1 sigma 54-interacting transcriptional regulator [Candidatus Aminicenantes bacterium AC-708-M15]MCP2606498.1 sigma 54-interacting transcriptional regulator [C
MNFRGYFSDFKDKKTLELIDFIKRKIALSKNPVLIKGPTGSGKEYFARLIHYYSDRKEKPFVKIDCANLIDELVHSELLGHTKGAYTDAYEEKTGKLELANGGTVFLDLVENLPLAGQSIIAFAVETGKFTKLGDRKETEFKARVIASTQSELSLKMREGQILPRFYYIIDVLLIEIPPLKERKADILPLINYFLQKTASDLDMPIKKMSDEAIKWCLRYSWPGNIRQLKNAIERIYISNPSSLIEVKDLLFLVEKEEELVEEASKYHLTLKQMEDLYISYILKLTNGNKSKAAKILGISRKTLYQKLKRRFSNENKNYMAGKNQK